MYIPPSVIEFNNDLDKKLLDYYVFEDKSSVCYYCSEVVGGLMINILWLHGRHVGQRINI